MGNENEADVSKSIGGTCNPSGLTSTADDESDEFDDDDIDLSSLRDSDDNYY